ncbi:MAG: tetraacyldisaccharide 4'-kinase [Candidatus Delongbacteria bacterium]|jgi:tetraacyldisaccharide 4'-kinase|nr:tetraacyldisaccharide 4'-kinase [Candidatus Delongbacteria bacterium]
MKLLNNKILFLLLSPLLLILSLLFSFAVILRHILYNLGILRSHKVSGKVISIGNISVGGTGKTPTVSSLVKELTSAGRRSTVITRGYKREGNDQFVVHNGNKMIGNVNNSGDEPFIIASTTNVPTICNSNRVSAAEFANKKFDPEFIVLDDAFQHRKIKRDIDIVLIDERRFLGNKFLLPFGILRDHVFRLNSADILILSKVSSVNNTLNSRVNYLKKFGKKVIISKMIADTIRNSEQEFNLENIRENDLFLFCGIGDPKNFYSTFKNMKVIGQKSFSDHYSYTTLDIDNILKTSAKYIITTQKDFVKLPDELQNNERIFYLDLNLEFYDDNFKKTTLLETIFMEIPEWQN